MFKLQQKFLMKKIFSLLLVFCWVLTSCSSDNHTYNNPNLLHIKFQFLVNLNLPQFNPLKFPGNAVYVEGYGNGGVILANNGTQVIAFDAGDPNHPFDNQCSTMLINGMEATCQCNDHNTYNLFSGTVVESKSNGDSFEYTMLQYRVIDNDNGTLTVRD